MTGDNHTLDLKEQLEEMREFRENMVDSVEEFYSENGKDREIPPHQNLLEQAARLVYHAIDIRSSISKTVLGEGRPITRTYYTLIGISTEILLTGIFLKNEPENFVEIVESQSGETPGFNKSKNHLMCDLSSDLNNEQRRRISLVLEIIQEHRNNLVHFGLGRMSFSNHPMIIYQVLRFLFARYSDGPIVIRVLQDDAEFNITDLLSERIVELEKYQTGMKYSQVDFDV